MSECKRLNQKAIERNKILQNLEEGESVVIHSIRYTKKDGYIFYGTCPHCPTARSINW